MLTLLKKSLLDRDFYKSDYKKIGIKNTLLYIFFVSFLASLIIAPIITIETVKTFIQIKNQILKVPPKIQIELSKKGLSTSIKEPLVFKIDNALIVIDPNTKYKPKKNGVTIVLRKKGFVTYKNKRIIDQKTYAFFGVTLKTTFDEIQKGLKNITARAITINVFLGALIILTILIFIQIIFLSIFVSIPYFLILKGLFRVNINFLQIFKRFSFLSTYFIIGYLITFMLKALGFPTIVNWGLVLFTLAYFFLAAVPVQKNKDNLRNK